MSRIWFFELGWGFLEKVFGINSRIIGDGLEDYIEVYNVEFFRNF